MSSPITYKELIERVRTMCTKKNTGTIFVRTDDNHSVIIGVRKGDIGFLSCGPRFGMEAIPIIKHLKTGSYRFEDVAVDHHAEQLPSSEKILELLTARGDSDTSVVPRLGRHSSADILKNFDTSAASKKLCALLQDYLGPIAPMVCEEAVSTIGELRASAQLHELVDRLATEIDNPEEAKAFRDQALDQLRGELLYSQ